MFSFAFFLECLEESAKGIPTTLLITVISIGIALVVGYLFAYVRIHKIPVLNQLVMLIVSIVRGTPVIAQLFLVYFCLPMAIMALYPDMNVYDINPLGFAFIVFTMNAVTGMTELMRSALSSVDKGQREAAQSIGMTGAQAYLRVIIPQAAVTALPALCNLTTTILKMTSLGMQISVLEITGRAKTLASASYRYLECFVACLVVYLLVNFVVERIFRIMELRTKRYKALAVN